MSAELESFVAAAPLPRGLALLARVPLAQQAAFSTLALGRYDDPAVARALGWDAERVIAAGRALRRAEGRP